MAVDQRDILRARPTRQAFWGKKKATKDLMPVATPDELLIPLSCHTGLMGKERYYTNLTKSHMAHDGDGHVTECPVVPSPQIWVPVPALTVSDCVVPLSEPQFLHV